MYIRSVKKFKFKYYISLFLQTQKKKNLYKVKEKYTWVRKNTQIYIRFHFYYGPRNKKPSLVE